MASEKNILVLGLLADNESSYSGSISLSTTTDGIHVAELPEFTIDYAYDGARPSPQGTAGVQRRVGPSGRTTTGTVSIEGKGKGSSYSSVNDTVNSLHPFIQASGLSGSFSGSSWVYQPTDPNSTQYSLAMDVYTRGEKREIRGAYCNMSIATDNPAPPLFKFETQGIIGLPTTSAAPTISYPSASVLPPKAVDVQFTVGGVSSLIIKSFEFNMNRDVAPRMNINSNSGHAGFSPNRRNPTLNVVVEATALATYDPYTAFANGTSAAVSLTVGSTTGNKYTINAPQCVISALTDEADGPSATWNITFEAYATTPAANDDITITFS